MGGMEVPYPFHSDEINIVVFNNADRSVIKIDARIKLKCNIKTISMIDIIDDTIFL